jgi:hypothetical protein
MSTFALVRRSLSRTVRNHGLITVLVVLLVLATVTVSWLARGATYGTAQNLTDGLGPRQIEVIQGYGGPESPALDATTVADLKEIKQVTDVFPSGSSGIDPPAELRESGAVEGPWWMMPQNPLDDRLTQSDGSAAPTLEADQMLVPGEFDELVGSTIEVGVTQALDATSAQARPAEFSVVGTYDPSSVQGEVPGAVFVEAERFDEIQARALPPGTPRYTSIYVYVDDVSSVAAVQAEIEQQGFGARSAIGSGVQLDQARQGLALVSLLLIAVTVVGALFAGTSVSGAWMTSRIEEIGLFRSLGWTRRKIVGLYLAEALAFALGVTVIGVALGAAVVLAITALPGLLTSLAGVQMDPQALLGHAWVMLVPLVVVPLGFALGTARRSATLLRADTDALLRQI